MPAEGNLQAAPTEPEKMSHSVLGGCEWCTTESTPQHTLIPIKTMSFNSENRFSLTVAGPHDYISL